MKAKQTISLQCRTKGRILNFEVCLDTTAFVDDLTTNKDKKPKHTKVGCLLIDPPDKIMPEQF